MEKQLPKDQQLFWMALTLPVERDCYNCVHGQSDSVGRFECTLDDLDTNDCYYSVEVLQKRGDWGKTVEEVNRQVPEAIHGQPSRWKWDGKTN